MQQLLDYFVPEKYDLDLKINREKCELRGVIKIIGESKKDCIKLHAENLCIESVLLNGEKAQYSCQDGVLNIESESQKVYLEIAYNTALNSNMEGAYLSTYKYKGKTEKIVTTQFESHYARQAFPCVDEPAAKAKFTIKIELEDYSSGDIILSNSPVKKTTKNVAEFEETPRMSTYLVAFVAGKFHGKTVKTQKGIEVTTYAPLNQKLNSVDFANEVAQKSLDYYEEQFGVPYPLQKCDQVAIPDFEAGAMENWGLVTYRSTMLLADKTATVSTKKSIALTVSHELSHQWFGNLVTMQWWDDLWLNESFASIMEYMATDEFYPEFNIWENFFTRDCISALRRDAYKDVQSVHQKVENVEDIANLFDGAIVYSKGARLMLMLIRTMGWDKFKKGLKKYFKKYQYQNTIGDNLWEELTGFADFDVKSFMESWIETPGYPVISENQKSRFLLEAKSEPKQLSNFQDRTAPTGAGKSERVLKIDNCLGDHPYPIAALLDDMSGHYLIKLSEENFNKKLKNFSKLSLEQKLRLLIDYSLLAKANIVESAKLLDLIQKFKSEKSAAIWSIISIIIGNLKLFVDPDSEEEKKYKKFVGNLAQEQLKNLGIKTKKQDTENEIRLRAIILSLAYYAEDRKTLEKLAKEYKEDLSELDPELRIDILDAKLYIEPKIFKEYLKKYQEEVDPEIQDDIFASITLAKEEKDIEKLIELLKEPEIVKPQDHLYLYIYLYRNPKATEKTFKWLTQNWEYVKKLTGDKTIADYPRYTANVIRTEAEKAAFWGFFEDKKSDPALVRTLKIAETEIDADLELIKSNKKAVQDRLKILVPEEGFEPSRS